MRTITSFVVLLCATLARSDPLNRTLNLLETNDFAAAIRYAPPYEGVNLQDKTFEVSYDHDTFLMDGKPFTFVSGCVHYFRLPHEDWEDRLKKVRLLGFNAISTYVEWSLHEPLPGTYNFEGDADIVQFIKLAQSLGLFVILRPGPYICAEREFGGFPAWLLNLDPNMKLRTHDPKYEYNVKVWMSELFKRIKPLLYGNGGPIITVQVENEYGNYPEHDDNYLNWLRDLYHDHVQDKAVLFTTDPSNDRAISRGRINNVFTTVDFGTSGGNIMNSFNALRKVQPHGPLVNSEFYTGWISYWGKPMAHVNTDDIVRNLRDLVTNKANVNCYMIFGGTNFGFTAGQDNWGNTPVMDLTSYDYEAPISEAGDLTDRYMKMWELLKSLGLDAGSKEEVEKARSAPKGKYGKVALKPVVALLDAWAVIGTPRKPSKDPLTMESYLQSYGFIAYTTTIKKATKDPSVLQADVRDRAILLMDRVPFSILANKYNNKVSLPPMVNAGSKLTILVENEGRRNYQLLNDVTKGIISKVLIDGQPQEDWDTDSYPLTSADIRKIENMATVDSCKYPAFFTGTFDLNTVSPDGHPYDTYLDMTGWGKGVVFINGHNIGRHWHIGPQMTLYVPGVWLNAPPNTNKITILELHQSTADRTIQFTDKPIYLNIK